ncbi:MAG: intradiol ring-cleavage dioxygenase [Bacteroidota bacterium]
MTARSLIALALLCTGCGSPGADVSEEDASLPLCAWCGADEAPEGLDWDMTIAGPDEDGERLVITGTVYEAGGTRPASGVLVYAYHADVEGVYPQPGAATGNGPRHGALRSWLRTNPQGRYRITTVRPAPPADEAGPARIHMTVQPPTEREYPIDEIVFAGDSLLTPAVRAGFDRRGGTGIVRLRRDAQGVWRGRRDILLER